MQLNRVYVGLDQRSGLLLTNDRNAADTKYEIPKVILWKEQEEKEPE